MCDRRGALKILAAATATPLLNCLPVYAQQPTIRGCFLLNPLDGQNMISNSRLGSNSDGRSNQLGSGDPRFDRVLGVMLLNLAEKFQVRPAFGFFDDGRSPNACALPNAPYSWAQGTVLFGTGLLGRTISSPHGDMSVMGVCAHEFAHILQFFTGYHAQLSKVSKTQKLVELHADFLSGYFVGQYSMDYSVGDLIALGRFWETLGDSEYTNENHHGSAKERLNSIEAGFNFVRERPEFNVIAACEVGARYLGI